jgi:hypothetical protein
VEALYLDSLPDMKAGTQEKDAAEGEVKLAAPTSDGSRGQD